jgi:PAS domain S-box-containing protein
MPDPLGEPPQPPAYHQIRILSLTSELGKIFAQDESEKANITAIDAIKQSFNASAAALFYINGSKVFSMCIAGTDFPIALPEPRWRECVETHGGGAGVSRFESWSVPGMNTMLASWISVCLYLSGDEGGYVFLGKAESAWNDQDAAAFASMKDAIAPIVEVRHERGIEEQKRKSAEKRLAANENRLRSLFEGSRDMIYSADAKDILTEVNNATLTLLGHAQKSDLIGRPFSEFVMNPADRDYFLKKIAGHGYVDDFEIMLMTKDGRPLFCLETASTLKNGSGTIMETQGIIKDISARIADEKKLWKMNLELTEANLKLQKTQMLMVQHEKLASIGQLAAGIAHEINNPLGFLTSNFSILEKHFGRIRQNWAECSSGETAPGPASEKAARLARVFSETEAIFNESRDGFKRIVTIVSNLKSFSRVDRTGDFDDFDLNAGIESTLVVASNEIKYVADVHKNLGQLPLIRANGGELNQVILNIVVNAAQALGAPARTDKGLIELSTSMESDKVLLKIHDNGPGIPGSILNRVFDPFFTTKSPGKGTGLGLSISYDIIVNKHGGALWVESDAMHGTTFFISLPVSGPPLQQPTGASPGIS